MTTFTIHLTADYEVFGNGSGDIKCCLLDPAEELMKVAERYRARVTFFVDVCEMWAFEWLEHSGLEGGASKPASRVREQLQDALYRGHDVQLHAHPQWIGAVWDDHDKNWILRLDRWRIGALPLPNASTEAVTAEDIVLQGVAWLEKLARPIDPTYICSAFRAGAWSIQPEAGALDALRKAGITYDTTVAPGAYRNDGLSLFDFRNAPEDLPFWHFNRKVDHPTKAGDLTELPICTSRQTILEAVLGIGARKLKKTKPNKPRGCKGTSLSSGYGSGRTRTLLNRVFTRYGRTQMLDYCSLTAGDMIRIVKRYDASHAPGVPWPLVTIGHPKNFADANELDAFLAWCNENPSTQLESLEKPSVWRHGVI